MNTPWHPQKLLGLCLVLASTGIAHARYGQGLWGFGGVGLGGVYVQTDEVNPVDNGGLNDGLKEQNKMGYSFHVKGGGSYYINSAFVFDLMGGYNISSVTGKAPPTGEAVTIKQQAGIFQVSARYRFGDLGRWQFGPLYKLYFGTDTLYSETNRNKTTTAISNYVGAHLNFDIPSATEKTIYRVGLEGMTSLNDPRTVIVGHVLFEIGFDLFGSERGYVPQPELYPDEEPTESPDIENNLIPGRIKKTQSDDELLDESPPPPPKRMGDPNAVSARSSGNSVVIRFPGDRFKFATGMSHIGSQQTRDYIRELGEFLSRNDSAWGKGVIVGHTDRRGPKGRERVVNLELSEARAKTVYNALVAAGVNGGKIRYEGRAFDEPVPGTSDDKEGWAMNRRVELTFEEVRAPDVILQQINALNRKYGYGEQGLSRP